MSEEAYYQSMKKINFIPALCLEHQLYHQTKVMLTMANKDPMNSFKCIMSIAYPKCGKNTPNCMEELRLKPTETFL